MTDQELKDLVAGLSISNAEMSIANAELRKSQQETDKLVRQVTKQLGELGNKFGSFTEGMALPSMEKILREQFGVNDIAPRRKAILNGHSLEIDVLAFDNTGARNEVYLVEIKSRLTDDAIKQMQKTIADFPRFFQDLADHKIYGIIAAVDIPDNLRAEVLKQGFYLARISDETFKLAVPRGFKPKAFGATEARNGHTNGQAKASAKKKKTGKK
ncbi:MAG: DUF3782 domain-containing protein [Acidobacteriota bacterium]